MRFSSESGKRTDKVVATKDKDKTKQSKGNARDLRREYASSAKSRRRDVKREINKIRIPRWESGFFREQSALGDGEQWGSLGVQVLTRPESLMSASAIFAKVFWRGRRREELLCCVQSEREL